jgi:hypothetical protein
MKITIGPEGVCCSRVLFFITRVHNTAARCYLLGVGKAGVSRRHGEGFFDETFFMSMEGKKEFLK